MELPGTISFPTAFISLGGIALDVAVGDQLAIVLQTNATADPPPPGKLFPPFSWRATTNVYTGGAGFVRRFDSDPWEVATRPTGTGAIFMGFQTFVDPMVMKMPEPSTWVLLAFGILAFAGLRLIRGGG